MNNSENHRKNQGVIAKAFARAREAHSRLVMENMIRLFENVATAEYVRLHEQKDLGRHLETSDSWGYALWKDGELAVMSTNGGKPSEEAKTIEDFFNGLDVPSSGWYGVFAASMEPIKYFRYDHENDIFNEIIPDVKRELTEAFKPKPKTRR